MEFRKEDVILLAKAVRDNSISFQDGGQWCADGYKCNHCFGERTDTEEEFKHEISCPVLVAKDLLTGVC